MAYFWEEAIKFFTEKGVTRGLAIAYIIISMLLAIMAVVAFIMWIIVTIKYFAGNRKETSNGKNGLQVAREMLDKAGLKHIQVKKANIFRALFFGNCYSITKKTIFLRGMIANKKSLTSVGLALQKVGIAQLCESGNKTAITRNRMQIVNLFGPILFLPIVLLGAVIDFLLFKVFSIFSIVSIAISVVILIAGFIVTLLNIPVEKKANKIALETMQKTGILTEEEQKIVKNVLDAYIVAYVMDFIVAVLRIVQLVLEIVIKNQIKKNNS